MVAACREGASLEEHHDPSSLAVPCLVASYQEEEHPPSLEAGLASPVVPCLGASLEEPHAHTPSVPPPSEAASCPEQGHPHLEEHLLTQLVLLTSEQREAHAPLHDHPLAPLPMHHRFANPSPSAVAPPPRVILHSPHGSIPDQAYASPHAPHLYSPSSLGSYDTLRSRPGQCSCVGRMT